MSGANRTDGLLESVATGRLIASCAVRVDSVDGFAQVGRTSASSHVPTASRTVSGIGSWRGRGRVGCDYVECIAHCEGGDRRAGLSIRDRVVVLASPRATPQDLDGLVGRGGPVRDAADELGDRRMIDASVVHGGTHERETSGIERIGDDVRSPHRVAVEPDHLGECIHLVDVARVVEKLGAGSTRFDLTEEPAALGEGAAHAAAVAWAATASRACGVNQVLGGVPWPPGIPGRRAEAGRRAVRDGQLQP